MIGDDFETGMREVIALLGVSGEDAQAFSAEALNLARTGRVEAADVARMLYYAASAGVPREHVVEATAAIAAYAAMLKEPDA